MTFAGVLDMTQRNAAFAKPISKCALCTKVLMEDMDTHLEKRLCRTCAAYLEKQHKRGFSGPGLTLVPDSTMLSNCVSCFRCTACFSSDRSVKNLSKDDAYWMRSDGLVACKSHFKEAKTATPILVWRLRRVCDGEVLEEIEPTKWPEYKPRELSSTLYTSTNIACDLTRNPLCLDSKEYYSAMHRDLDISADAFHLRHKCGVKFKKFTSGVLSSDEIYEDKIYCHVCVYDSSPRKGEWNSVCYTPLNASNAASFWQRDLDGLIVCERHFQERPKLPELFKSNVRWLNVEIGSGNVLQTHKDLNAPQYKEPPTNPWEDVWNDQRNRGWGGGGLGNWGGSGPTQTNQSQGFRSCGDWGPSNPTQTNQSQGPRTWESKWPEFPNPYGNNS